MNSAEKLGTMEIPNGKVVIEFYSPRCKSCQDVQKILDEVLEEFEDVRLIRVNVFENREFARSFDVIALPVIIALKDGIEVGRLKGAKSRSEIVEFLREVFG
ncbi:thioredoxin family protein [Archaeoglobus profundus]|uniref:Thioredoxin domain protein n=1 Tax=Archaeoglobus profundus (strain DSM 5631 / JCM 9629 / NBRC 100127 / Av18) TaxID=572546 RepID=D2RHW5_ARCPA|nr:thioredoxin family protein [Archaeoglobus profundus]ADB57890.1 Thioredoxin domain protein [Archaeoglobus profundus DSM 5631]